jgi:hypothetical protein
LIFRADWIRRKSNTFGQFSLLAHLCTDAGVTIGIACACLPPPFQGNFTLEFHLWKRLNLKEFRLI